MSSRKSFLRKIVYLVAIALLLMPLFWLSQPATTAVKGSQGSPGGKLAQLRNEYHLSQAQLGEIDPTSVTLKLATLGMRGVAANILWEKAFEYKMKKDWTNFGATLSQITKIQPNFINVWSSQAHNLSYNISAEFDDFRQRYHWVIKGIDFLKEGMKYNERQPRLLWDTGWTVSQKIGKSDEHKQFRKLFKEDDDFHGSRPLALRDNWLVGMQWYDAAVKMVEAGARMIGKDPLIYRSSGPLCQMYYADFVEKDGTFGEVAKGAWAEAARLWQRYGSEEIPTTFRDEQTDEPIFVRLNEQEMEEEKAAKLAAQLDALQPGLRAKLIAEKRKTLTDKQREALDLPLLKRTPTQVGLADDAGRIIETSYNEVARKITGENRSQAIKLANQIADTEKMARYIRHYRQIINFVYWRTRGEIEQSSDMLAARKLLYQGDQAYANGDLVAARNAYRLGMEGWRKVLDKHPDLVYDQTTGEDLMVVIKRYRRILSQLDEPFPEKFILQDIINFVERPAKPPESQTKKPAS